MYLNFIPIYICIDLRCSAATGYMPKRIKLSEFFTPHSQKYVNTWPSHLYLILPTKFVFVFCSIPISLHKIYEAQTCLSMHKARLKWSNSSGLHRILTPTSLNIFGINECWLMTFLCNADCKWYGQVSKIFWRVYEITLGNEHI